MNQSLQMKKNFTDEVKYSSRSQPIEDRYAKKDVDKDDLDFSFEESVSNSSISHKQSANVSSVYPEKGSETIKNEKLLLNDNIQSDDVNNLNRKKNDMFSKKCSSQTISISASSIFQKRNMRQSISIDKVLSLRDIMSIPKSSQDL